MIDPESLFEGPIKKSIDSVFDTVNLKTEALDLLRKYKNANKALVRSLVENVQILGMSEPIKLAEIYSTTYLSTTIHRRLYNAEWANITNIDSKLELMNGRKSKTTLRADEYISEHDRIVVLAGPGSGKTTLLKYTALSYIDDDIYSKSSLKTRKVPFFISLPDLVNTQSNIVQYISDRIKLKTHPYAIEYVKRCLDKGTAAVLLDSLDEVPMSNRERAYELIQELSISYPKCKIIITCRVADYDITLEGFYEVEIARLSQSAIHKIIKAWFKKTPKKAKELIDHLSVDKDVYSLTETPLILSLLCIQYSNDLNIPNRKIELYSRCMDALLRLWDTSRGFRRDTAFSSLTDDRKQKLFSEVAHTFLCEKGEQYIFPEDELINIISRYIERFSIPPEQSSEILKEIESHHGILEKYSAESYAFSHVSFQEYFVAYALVAKRIEFDFVKKHKSNPRVASVITFIVALMDDPSDILKFLKDKSQLTGIKTYPAMSSRIEVLLLLYRCMNAGVSISPALRGDIYNHIASSQIEISKVYHAAKTYPIANIEHDGIRHTYFYREKIRETLEQALRSYRKLSNEILLSPNKSYSEYAMRFVDEYTPSKDRYINFSVLTCMLIPLAGSHPEIVIGKMDAISLDLINDGILHKIATSISGKIRENYLTS